MVLIKSGLLQRKKYCLDLQEHENKIIKQPSRPQISDLQKSLALPSLSVSDLSKSGPEPE